MPRTWTNEQKALQALRCRMNRPWEHSTGPRTDAGKARSSMNAYKGDPLKRADEAMREGDYDKALRILNRHLKKRKENLTLMAELLA